ncbi:GlxA family transcriptional regulator [Kribbella sp.]|uniref:GlxA family transcriptional regulator n=1 Tax=Kribbella sp. TaxID=1871183 RepID=UPI002D31A480|nr:GlxA family transcriptional regulator [Kribbella sp.]HZX01475.1 GlxA family transcriptional regulator [Kribbella sp.]
MPRARKVVFVVFDGVKSLDVAGPAEVFAEANRFGGRYTLQYVSPSGEAVSTSTGASLPVDGPADGVSRTDTVVVCGGDVLVGSPIDPELIAAIQVLRPRARRVVSICTGSFALAASGALAGRRATTHWRHTRLLARAFPDIDVLPDALFVEDRGVFTSAGVSAGIDLALALVEADHGPDVARAVARSLVVFMQRPGGQSQFSAPLELRRARTPTLREIVDLISADPGLDHSAQNLADRVGVSTRHLVRLFQAEFGMTPATYVEQVRIDHAKALLDAGHTVEQTAAGAGFGSSETLRRVFVARLGVSPSQYRNRFASAARS